MKMTVMDGCRKYHINLKPITQLIGNNIPLKAFLCSSMEKHFSSSRYMEYEEKMVENVLVDGGQIGRKYFAINVIRTRQDMLSELKIGKTSKMKMYLQYMMQNVDYQSELFEIERNLQKIFQSINTIFSEENSMLELSFQENELMEIIQTAEVKAKDQWIEVLSNKELFIEYIKMLEHIQEIKGIKTMIIIENIDHLLTREEFLEIMELWKNATEKSDLWVVVTTSLEKYVYVTKEDTDGIHCVEEEIIILPQFDEIKNFVVENYPLYYEFNDKEISGLIQEFSSIIGNVNQKVDLRKYILCKLFQKSECLGNMEILSLSEPEKSFLFG